MIVFNARPLLVHVGLAALSAGIAAPALAQTAKPLPAEQATPDQTVPTAAATDGAALPVDGQAASSAADASPSADIVVTGSRIRGVPGSGSNVIAIDQNQIAQEPVTSSADLLRRVPQVVTLGANPAGGSAQNGAANATRSAGINLRGLGNTATLILYDGKRLPAQGTQGQITDPSVIPTIAISRVEVVADGASAIYGSDAIAGVVNFIVRKDLNGEEVRVRSGVTDNGSYNEQQVSAIVGRRWQGGSIMVAGEYTRNSILSGADLPFYQSDNRSRGGLDYRNTFCNPGTITAGGQTYPIPQGGVTPATAGSLVAGAPNKCFYNGADAVLPKQERESVIGEFSQQLGDSVRLFADGFYSHRTGETTGIAGFTATVPNTNPFFVSPVPGATSVNVDYSTYPQTGAYTNPFYSYSWNASGGLEAKLFGDIQGTVYYSHGESKDVANSIFGVNNTALGAALADTNPATALNVFGGPNNPATLARILDNYFVITGASRLDVANLQFNGSLLTLPGGKLRFAVGGEYRREYTFTDLGLGSSVAQFHIAGAGSRDIKAAFGEFYLPLFGPDNARPGIQELSVSVAGRFEHYSDFGNTSNPKIGLTYRPVNGVNLRATYGTSFRAPSFIETSQVAGGAGLYVLPLPGPNGTLNGISIGGGNPNLKPETAKTWSVGAQVQPTGLRGLVAGVTYFHIDYRNQIQALFLTPGLLTNPLYASFVNLNPTPAQVAALVASGLPVNGVISPGAVQYIADGRRQNLGASRVAGLDYNLSYNWQWGGWKLDGGINGSYFLQYKFQPVPGAPFTEVVNTINFPQRFRMQADAGVSRGKLRARVTLNHLSGYANTGVAPTQHVSSYDTVDLYLGADVNDRFTVAVQARNLFNRYPPFVDTTFGYDPQSANPLPRLLMVSAGVKF